MFVSATVFAGAIPGPKDYKIMLIQPSVVNGVEFKVGECHLILDISKVTLEQNKNSVVVPAKVLNMKDKYDVTEILYIETSTISEIRVGGTKTKVVILR